MRPLPESEAQKYRDVWASPPYRRKAHGLDLWRNQRHLFPEHVETALDIGCGHGRLMARWFEEGIDAWGVDIVDGLDDEVREQHGDRLIVAPIWDLRLPDLPIWDRGAPRIVDLGVAADVLEHLPTEMVDQSLRAIARACRVFVCQNAEFPSRHLGHTLHLTMKPAAWWRTRMEAIGGRVKQLPYRGDRRKHVLRWHTGAVA